jgi:hypothetical protein
MNMNGSLCTEVNGGRNDECIVLYRKVHACGGVPLLSCLCPMPYALCPMPYALCRRVRNDQLHHHPALFAAIAYLMLI